MHAAPAPMPGPAIDWIALGDVQIAAVLDGMLPVPVVEAAPDLATADPEALVARARSRGLDTGPDGRVELPVICHVLRFGSATVVVDAGLGPRPPADWPAGRLDRALAALEIDPGEVDLVVLTHLHADHIGWLVRPGPGPDRPTFPTARHVVHGVEWEWWVGDGRIDRPEQAHLRACLDVLRDRVEIDLVDDGTALRPGLVVRATPGHTPGHIAVEAASRGRRALLVGDATHVPGQLDDPDWSTAWDVDPVRAAATRRRLFETIAADPRAMMLTSHWPFPGAVRIGREGSALVARPVRTRRGPGQAG